MRKTDKRGSIGTIVVAIVVAVVVIVTVLMVWRAARKSAREAGVVNACREYANAQRKFYRGDRDGDGQFEFAEKLIQLGSIDISGGRTLVLIDKEFGQAGDGKTPYRGYLFREIPTINGVLIDPCENYALCATPAEYGVSGQRTFIVSSNGNGMVFAKDLGESKFISDYPANPVKQKWNLIE